jgi:hypothetical protein
MLSLPAIFTELFRRIVLSTTSCSFDKLTIRVDMFLTIVPALCSVDPAPDPGLRLLRIELERLMPSSLLLLIPASACARSSPRRDIPVEGVIVENRTLRVLLPLFPPVGVDCTLLAPAIGARWLGSVRGVRSFDGAIDEGK